MYIRNREDALDVLTDTLNLPSRTEQLVSLTVKIALCLDPDPRMFLADAQAGIIEGGLDGMRRRRREILEQVEADQVVILDPEEDALFEEVASTRDALRIVKLVQEVFPEVAQDEPLWILARAVLGHESEIQECLRRGIKSRGEDGDPTVFAQSHQDARQIINRVRPEWENRAAAVRQACLDVVRGAELATEGDAPLKAEFLFTVIAARDERAEAFITWLDRDPKEAVDFVSKLSELHEALLEMEASEETAGSGFLRPNQ